MCFSDFNGDGRVDSGEAFIAYEIWEDVKNHPGCTVYHPRKRRKLSGVEVFAILAIAYEILKLLCR